MIKLHKSLFDGEIIIEPSKSFMQRLLALAYLSDDTTEIINPSYCQDSVALLNLIEQLGSPIIKNPRYITIYPVQSKEKNELPVSLNCHESALCLRMMLPVLALSPNKFILNGEKSLQNRKVFELDTLQKLGASIISNENKVPIEIEGPITNGQIKLKADASSQLLTGLLIALPKLANKSEIIVEELRSRPYIDLTLDLVNKFGGQVKNYYYTKFEIIPSKYKGGKYAVEGDWSSGAVYLAAGAIAGSCSIFGLNPSSKQADKAIIDILTEIGAKIIINDQFIEVKKNELKPFEFDAVDTPDLIPVLAAIAANCNGLSKITNVKKLKFKESDRLSMIYNNFKKMGISLEIENETLKIWGGKYSGGVFETSSDHRMAMCGALLSLNSESEVIIENPECVAKSAPSFWLNFNKGIQD